MLHARNSVECRSGSPGAGLSYDDPVAARAWFSALVFAEGILVMSEDGRTVEHSEMVWPEGGRVMVSSRDREDHTFVVPRGAGSVYVVVDAPARCSRGPRTSGPR